MTFSDAWTYPENHPISHERAQELMLGEMGREYFRILKRACAPIYWHAPGEAGQRRICANGTLTFVQSAERTFGVTAAHVVNEYRAQRSIPGLALQLGNAELDLDIISQADALDLVTLNIPDTVRSSLGKDAAAVSLPRPHDVPQEGRGIMICGYTGSERKEHPERMVEWGMLGVVGVARRVNEKQITWSPDHERHEHVEGQPMLPPHKELGGISGGPLIAWFEKADGMLAYYSLAGIIVEANAAIENVVAIRSEYIRADGSLRH